MKMEWTPEKVEALVKLHGSGEYSTVEMADRMGVTKNAIVGKIRRLGLSDPNKNPVKRGSKRNRKKPKLPKSTGATMRPSRRAIKVSGIREGEPHPIGEMPGGCLWLHGEASDRNFCGHDRQEGSSYCDHHHPRTVIKYRRKEDRDQHHDG